MAEDEKKKIDIKLVESPDVERSREIEERAGTVKIYIMGKGYTVPAGLTIMITAAIGCSITMFRGAE